MKKEEAFYNNLDLGKQILIWCLGCQEKAFALDYLDNVLEQACEIAKVKVVKTVSHIFPIPDKAYDGLTIVKVLAESDLTVHTYPKAEEGKSITISFYACGEQSDPAATINFFKKALGAKKVFVFKPMINYKLDESGWQEIK